MILESKQHQHKHEQTAGGRRQFSMRWQKMIYASSRLLLSLFQRKSISVKNNEKIKSKELNPYDMERGEKGYDIFDEKNEINYGFFFLIHHVYLTLFDF